MTIDLNSLIRQALARIQEISPLEVTAARADGALLIDVREPDEFAAGHLPQAINLPRGVLEFRIQAHPAMACQASEALSLRERPLVLYCLTGGRAALAADSLQQLGFERVKSMAGGITAWREAGLPLHTPTDSSGPDD
ncbi:rhodanese-like domain-containing protein [Pseudoxanthomonas wuyuanensis]